MDPQKSYDAKVRALARSKAKQEHSFYLSLFATLETDEAIYHWQKKQLQLQIDKALELGDRASFFKLAKKYKQFVR